MHFRLNLICLMLMACRPQSEVSDLKHDAAQYVLSPESWHWQDLTPQEFEDVYLPGNGWGSVDDFLPSSHAATQRMDYLLTRIHDRIKEHHPDQLLNVPAPRARIYRGESPDAFVTTVPVCYSVPVRLKNTLAAQNPESDTDWITLDHNGNLSGASHDGICLQRSMNQDEARDYFDWISRNIRRSASQQGQSDNLCQLDVQASYDGFEVVPNPSCQRAPELADITQAKGFVIWKTQPYIVLYTGLLQHVDAEIKIITTLAHELAHYYRSHLTSFAGDYDYFYYQDAKANPSHKPKPDVTLQARGREIRAAAQLVQSYLEHEHGQNYSSELFFPVWALASRACPSSAKEPCPEACRSFVEFLNDPEVNASLGYWPYESMPESGHCSYQRYEQGLKACAPHLRLTDAETGGSRISIKDLEETVEQENFGETLKAMGIENLAEFKGQSLEQMIARWEQGLEQARIRSLDVIHKANADGIGFYTTEQEADEQQMETVVRLGLDPAQLVAWDVEFYKNMEGTYDEHQGLDMKRCGELLMKQWIEDGRPVLVPVADYNDIHHSDCYRIFTSSREIAAHHYDKPDPEVPIQFLSDLQWKELQVSLFQ